MNLYSSPRIGGCTVPLASGSSAPLPSSRGPCRQAGWIIAEGALALHAGPPHPNTPVGSPYGRRSAPGIPRQTNAGRAHPAPTPIAHRPPASQHPSWGPSWAALCAWYSTPNQCGEGTPGAHPISLSPQPMWGGMALSASTDLHTGPPHIPAVTSPRGALKGGVQRLAFHAKPIWGDPPESTPHTGPSAPLLPSRRANAEGALASHSGPRTPTASGALFVFADLPKPVGRSGGTTCRNSSYSRVGITTRPIAASAGSEPGFSIAIRGTSISSRSWTARKGSRAGSATGATFSARLKRRRGPTRRASLPPSSRSCTSCAPVAKARSPHRVPMP